MIGFWLITFVTFVYVAAACAFAANSQHALALTYFGYIIANAGVLWLAYQTR